MSQFEVAETKVAAGTQTASSAYAPPLQRTQGQPPPIAPNFCMNAPPGRNRGQGRSESWE